ncbi:MAG: outer membrane beta-barrel protein [Arenimonas sp.]
MKYALLVLALAAALPQMAQAEELSYSYVEAGYTANDYDNSILDTFDGFYINGSYNFSDTGFYINGSHKQTSGDISGNSGYDIDNSSLGFGYHHEVADTVDLVGQLDYIHTDVNFGDSINGYRVSAGVRGSFSEKFEGSVMGHYENISDIDASDSSISFEGQYKFNETLGLVAGVEFGQHYENDVVGYNIGLRASF